ncbi:MAG: DNA-3-methyladenine glycosylase I [Candidatus Paceibacterota bacterium]
MKEKVRCAWPSNDLLMVKYHDEEWGVPIKDDKKIFEFLVLESAQAGLSWRTILYKRNGYKKAFVNFDPKRVSKFTKKDVNRLIKNPQIIRNKLKIESTINNAKRFLEVQKEFGSFSKYMWGFVKDKQIDGKRKTLKELPVITKEAEEFSKDLKKRGFKFLGSTIVYAHMQAVGMVNDHTTNCFRYKFKMSPRTF